MEWAESLRKAIQYMEDHLLEEIGSSDVAEKVYLSPFYFQKGFKILTGYTPSEYIRNRRLYLAALDAIAGREKIIDLAYKYGYDTPESFSKAFSRFHGVSPLQIRGQAWRINTFLPLKIKLSIQGGTEMNYTVEKKNGFQVIGFEKKYSYDNAYLEIPRDWDAFARQYCAPMFAGKEPETEQEKAVCAYNIGEFGVCIDDCEEKGKFRYLIAGTYTGGSVPEGMTVYSFPDLEWAQFACIGPMPGSLQSVNTKIFQEWLPNNPEFEIAMGANIEWYSKGDTSALDYESAIWIPVKRK